MTRKPYSVEQIVAILNQAEDGGSGGGVDSPKRGPGADVLSLEETLGWKWTRCVSCAGWRRRTCG